MRITIFGASGKIGQLVVADALAAGYEVTAFVHRHDPFADLSNLTVVKGNIHSAKEVADAIKGSHAVISTLGSWGTTEKDIVSIGTQNIMQAMETQKVLRLITLTGADARAANDTYTLLHRITHTLIRYSPGRSILSDSEQHLVMLEASTLNWTVIRSPIMKDGGNHTFKFTDQRPLPWATINRSAVAAAMLTQLQANIKTGRAPFITQS